MSIQNNYCMQVQRMIDRLVFLFLLSTVGSLSYLQAQEIERQLGVVWDDSAYESLPQFSPFQGQKDKIIAPRVDLKPFAPIPADQGNTGACVAYALCNAMAISDAVQSGNQAVSNPYSPMFIYNQVKAAPGNCKIGSSVEKSINFLKETGTVRLQDFDPKYDCSQLPGKGL